jgi:hypothetical protein
VRCCRATHGWFSRRIRIIRLRWVQGPLVDRFPWEWPFQKDPISAWNWMERSLYHFIPLDHLFDANFCWLNPPFIITLW